MFLRIRGFGAAGVGLCHRPSIHFLSIVFGGVIDNFPNSTIILGGLSEGLPFGRHQLHNHSIGAVRAHGLKRAPIEYLTRNPIVTTSGNFSVPSRMCAARMLGIDNTIFPIDRPCESSLQAIQFLDSLPSPESSERLDVSILSTGTGCASMRVQAMHVW